jgi:hypothetical protein
MISKFIRAQWESNELECMDDERRHLLEEAAELDHRWGAWETGAELTNDPIEWLKQPSLSRDDLRYQVVAHASHREQRWDPPSASLIPRDPVLGPQCLLMLCHICLCNVPDAALEANHACGTQSSP